MIFRAAFWIAVVVVFLPHEPDVGYGRPGENGDLITALRDTIQSNIGRVKTDLRAADAAEHGGGNAIADRIERFKRDSQGAAGPIAGLIEQIGQTGSASLGGKIEQFTQTHPDPIGEMIAKPNSIRAEGSLP